MRAPRDFPRGEAFALLLVAQRLQRDGAVVFQRADGGGDLPTRQAAAQTIQLFRELGVDGVRRRAVRTRLAADARN